MALAVLMGALPVPARAADPADLTDLGLEDLMNLNVSVTSAGRKPQRLSNVAAAAFVLTGEDIRRSGARTIPEALRLVPGVQVARIDRNNWAISVRGFNGRFANKLLVLMDGRSVYTQAFSGVFWDLQDTMLEDIDRIEVIRGPGAALWGANAVNGVINIITKPSSATQGGLLTGGGGTEERGFGAFRFGGTLGEVGTYRAFAKYARRDAGLFADGSRATDGSDTGTFGFRADLRPSASDTLMISGGVTQERYGDRSVLSRPTAPFATQVDSRNDAGNAHLLARWSRTLSATSEVSLQGYFTRESYNRPDSGITTTVFDIEGQHRFAWGDRHDIVWGGGYRYYTDAGRNTFNISIDPLSRSYNFFSIFAQDEIRLVGDALLLTVGSRLEHNPLTGVEVQPNVRLLWQIDPDNALWTAVSRAVRTPSRGERDARVVQSIVDLGGGNLLSTEGIGRKNFGSESVIAFELGYRTRPWSNVSVDVAGFYNIYDRLRFADLRTPFFSTDPVPRTVLPIPALNGLAGETYGMEIASEWQPTGTWRLRLGYAFLEMNLRSRNGVDTLGDAARNEGRDPQHQVSLQSSWDISRQVQADAIFRYVSGLPSLNIDGYASLDLRLAWRPSEALEFAIVGQNLLASSRMEFRPESLASAPTRTQRGAYAIATVKF